MEKMIRIVFVKYVKPRSIMHVFDPGDEESWIKTFRQIEYMHRGSSYLSDLMYSIQTEGMKEPILLGNDGRIWDGHHRLYIADQLKLESIPVLFSANHIEGPQEKRTL